MFFFLSSSLCDYCMPLKQFASSLFHGVDYSLGQVSIVCGFNLAMGLFRCERLKGQQ